MSEDLPALLSVNVITLGLESCLSFQAIPVTPLSKGDIDRLLSTHEVLLANSREDPILFGKSASTVYSDALARLYSGLDRKDC